jgi:hypothetical protein
LSANPLVRVLLNEAEWGRIKYILIMWPVTVIPALLIATIMFAVVLGFGVDAVSYAPSFEGDIQARPVFLLYSGVILFPFIESLLMGALIRFLQNFTQRLFVVALVSAIVWAVLHSLAAPLWGLGVLWGFFVFSVAFMVWGREKFMNGVWVATAIHGLNNLTAMSLLIFL